MRSRTNNNNTPRQGFFLFKINPIYGRFKFQTMNDKHDKTDNTIKYEYLPPLE